jgi:hypothetical protein
MNYGFPFNVGLFVADEKFPNIMSSIPAFPKSGATREPAPSTVARRRKQRE